MKNFNTETKLIKRYWLPVSFIICCNIIITISICIINGVKGSNEKEKSMTAKVDTLYIKEEVILQLDTLQIAIEGNVDVNIKQPRKIIHEVKIDTIK